MRLSYKYFTVLGLIARFLSFTGNALKQHGVASTSGTGLACKNIVHVPFQNTKTDWTNKMVACLKEAESLKAKSVAFPVLGAGTYRS